MQSNIHRLAVVRNGNAFNIPWDNLIISHQCAHLHADHGHIQGKNMSPPPMFPGVPRAQVEYPIDHWSFYTAFACFRLAVRRARGSRDPPGATRGGTATGETPRDCTTKRACASWVDSDWSLKFLLQILIGLVGGPKGGNHLSVHSFQAIIPAPTIITLPLVQLDGLWWISNWKLLSTSHYWQYSSHC